MCVWIEQIFSKQEKVYSIHFSSVIEKTTPPNAVKLKPTFDVARQLIPPDFI